MTKQTLTIWLNKHWRYGIERNYRTLRIKNQKEQTFCKDKQKEKLTQDNPLNSWSSKQTSALETKTIENRKRILKKYNKKAATKEQLKETNEKSFQIWREPEKRYQNIAKMKFGRTRG